MATTIKIKRIAFNIDNAIGKNHIILIKDKDIRFNFNNVKKPYLIDILLRPSDIKW